MQVHIRQAMSDKCSQEAAPNENAPHVLFHIKKRTKYESMGHFLHTKIRFINTEA